jgi:hypothetical protein
VQKVLDRLLPEVTFQNVGVRYYNKRLKCHPGGIAGSMTANQVIGFSRFTKGLRYQWLASSNCSVPHKMGIKMETVKLFHRNHLLRRGRENQVLLPRFLYAACFSPGIGYYAKYLT